MRFEKIAQLVLTHLRKLELLILIIRVEQKRIVRSMVADEKHLFDRFKILKHVFDFLRGNGFTFDVLVDVLLPVYYPVKPIFVFREDVPCRKPFLFIILLAFAKIAFRDVWTPNQHFSVVGELYFNAGKHGADGVVPILMGRGHGYPARRFRHAKSAHQFDATILKQTKNIWVQVAGGGKSPFQISTRYFLSLSFDSVS